MATATDCLSVARLARPARWLQPLARMLYGLALAAFSALAGAHPSPQSDLLLDVGANSVQAELTLPLEELKLAFSTPLIDGSDRTGSTDTTGSHVLIPDAQMAAYVAAHLRPVAPDGRAWVVKVTRLRWLLAARPADLVASVEMRPPAGAPVGDFTLTMDAIGHQVPNHITMVALRDSGARTLARPRMLGALRFGQRSIDIKGADQRWWVGFSSLFKLGMEHIAGGADHLLFLLTLLLPCALVAHEGRWTKFGGTRHLVVNLLGVVSAFTAGHSLTLLLGAIGVLSLPSQPVEVAIALSIMVSALHAWRPLFARREGWIAAGFGLIHGLAFSSAVRQLELSGARLAAGVLAFNLGIEAVQAIIVAIVAPMLVLLARTRYFSMVRQGAALVAGMMALVWMVERVGG